MSDLSTKVKKSVLLSLLFSQSFFIKGITPTTLLKKTQANRGVAINFFIV
jgi:hypothetical protein